MMIDPAFSQGPREECREGGDVSIDRSSLAAATRCRPLAQQLPSQPQNATSGDGGCRLGSDSMPPPIQLSLHIATSSATGEEANDHLLEVDLARLSHQRPFTPRYRSLDLIRPTHRFASARERLTLSDVPAADSRPPPHTSVLGRPSVDRRHAICSPPSAHGPLVDHSCSRFPHESRLCRRLARHKFNYNSAL